MTTVAPTTILAWIANTVTAGAIVISTSMILAWDPALEDPVGPPVPRDTQAPVPRDTQVQAPRDTQVQAPREATMADGSSMPMALRMQITSKVAPLRTEDPKQVAPMVRRVVVPRAVTDPEEVTTEVVITTVVTTTVVTTTTMTTSTCTNLLNAQLLRVVLTRRMVAAARAVKAAYPQVPPRLQEASPQVPRLQEASPQSPQVPRRRAAAARAVKVLPVQFP